MLSTACEAVGGSKSTHRKLVVGCVGEGAATVFLAWVDQQDLPDPRAVLANPGSLKMPKRFDLAKSVMSGVIGVVKGADDGVVWEQGYDVLEQVFHQNREVALSAHGALIKCKPKGYDPKHRNGSAIEMQELLTQK